VVLAVLQQHRACTLSSAQAWTVAREDVRILGQALDEYLGSLSSDRGAAVQARDRAMAENVSWILAHQRKGAKIMLWAHNGHINRYDEEGATMMGGFLHRTFGRAYRPIGFVFDEGGLRAHGRDDSPRGTAVQVFELGPRPPNFASAAFVRAGQERSILDLRSAPAGVVADWLAAPYLVLDLGSAWNGEGGARILEKLSVHFDAVIFVRHAHASHPNPTGLREY
jgi:erythromycin esterase